MELSAVAAIRRRLSRDEVFMYSAAECTTTLTGVVPGERPQVVGRPFSASSLASVLPEGGGIDSAYLSCNRLARAIRCPSLLAFPHYISPEPQSTHPTIVQPPITKLLPEILVLLAKCIVQNSEPFSLTDLVKLTRTCSAIHLPAQRALLQFAAKHDAELVVDPPSLQNLVDEHRDEHIPLPRLPYILKAVRMDRPKAARVVNAMITFCRSNVGYYIVPGCFIGNGYEHDPDPIFLERNAQVASRLSPLHVATYCGHSAMFANLLKHTPCVGK